MTHWRDGVAREIPTDIEGDLLEWIDEAWDAFSSGHGGRQLGEAELDLIEGRLRQMESCRDERVHLLDGWQTNTEPPATLCIIVRAYDTWEPAMTGGVPVRCTGYEDRLAGIFELPRSVGGVALIRPETIGDKISELFSRNEVDFDESPTFSRKYYLPATDPDSLRAALSKEVLDHIATRDELTAELLHRDMLVLWPERPAKRTILDATNFFIDLARFIGSGGGPYR